MADGFDIPPTGTLTSKPTCFFRTKKIGGFQGKISYCFYTPILIAIQIGSISVNRVVIAPYIDLHHTLLFRLLQRIYEWWERGKVKVRKKEKVRERESP